MCDQAKARRSPPSIEMTWRRLCRSPRLALVTIFSTKGWRALALGIVVVIWPCSKRLAAMLRSIAVRWAVVRPSL
jgi:hypothetical protein